jgi:outer membrane protein assembly factor BamB
MRTNFLTGAAIALFLIGLQSVVSAAPRAAGGDIDWPQFRFDRLHNGNQTFESTLNATNVRSAGLLWLGELGGELVDMSSPAVVGGVVYIGEFDGNFAAYSADGCGDSICSTPLWSAKIAEIDDSPTVANGIVYIGSQTNANDASLKLNAFDAAGCGKSVCSPLWQGDAGAVFSSSSPTVWKDRVFIGGGDGNVYAFKAKGCGKPLCKPVWKGSMAQGTESAPVVYQGTLFIGNIDGKLYAFAANGCGNRTCAPLWTTDTGGANFNSSPAVANGIVYIAADHELSAIDANGCGKSTCEPLWQAVDNNNFFDGSPAIADGYVYLGVESQLNVYKAKGCGNQTCNPVAVLFGTGAQDAIVSSPTVANGVVYVGRNSGEVLAWPVSCVKNGGCNEIWKGFTDDPLVTSSPTVVNGKIYIGSSDHGFGGRLYVYGLAN